MFKHGVNILMEDFSAEIGKNRYEKVVRPQGLGTRKWWSTLTILSGERACSLVGRPLKYRKTSCTATDSFKQNRKRQKLKSNEMKAQIQDIIKQAKTKKFMRENILLITDEQSEQTNNLYKNIQRRRRRKSI